MTGRPDDQERSATQPSWTAETATGHARESTGLPEHSQDPYYQYADRGWSGPDRQEWPTSQETWPAHGQWSADQERWSTGQELPAGPAGGDVAGVDPATPGEPGAGGQHRRSRGAPRPRRRLRRIALFGIAGLVVAALATAVGAAAISHYYLGEIERIPDPFAAIPAEQRPSPTPQGSTILLAGVDSQAPGATGADSSSTPHGRTDSLMVVRITADRKRAYVVSIPRDSWVPIPGHENFKINAAYAYGGASLAVQTVENVTGLRIDHVALIDLAGLRDLTDAVGGVTVDIPAGTPNPGQRTSWPSGPQRLDGEQAVQYVRQRHGLPEGDFDRMRRHQNYLRALLTETLDRDTLTSPRQLGALLEAVTRTVTVDEGLTNDKLRQLAFDLHTIRNNVQFVTAPVADTGYVGDQWVMWLDTERGVDFWNAIRDDSLEQYRERYGIEQLDSVVR
ncbi:LCP family protein [Solwaraspora sp. WMMB335]|uniref:LCP family protein n=1 Tax=Solwaraspora sp. WMMB335 TaxID=3404118 RepID=UPI003B928FB0